MIRFVFRQLAHAFPVVVLSTAAVFLLLHLVPGDPALILAGPDASPEAVEEVRRDLGLDRPLPVQYGLWIGRLIRGDLGLSFANRLPVDELIIQRLPATLELAAAGMLLTILIAVPTGILSARNHHGLLDWLISTFNGVAIAIPNFWFGILAILLFTLQLGWLPPGGRVSVVDDPWQGVRFLILPSLTLALHPAASLSRLVKASMLEVLAADYVRTARAKGLSEARVIQRHAFRNTMAPVMTVLGLQLGRLLGGAVIVESVFAWPGMGQLILDGIGNRDYSVIQSALLLLVLIFVFVNILTDLAYGLVDPRIRLSGGAGK